MDILTESPSSATVNARLVTGEERLRTLPKHFGPRQLTVEHAVFTWMRELATEYRGGVWQFYELSNGGFYMAPQVEPLHLRVEGNGFDGQMSADAAGITACRTRLITSSTSYAARRSGPAPRFYGVRRPSRGPSGRGAGSCRRVTSGSRR